MRPVFVQAARQNAAEQSRKAAGLQEQLDALKGRLQEVHASASTQHMRTPAKVFCPLTSSTWHQTEIVPFAMSLPLVGY